MEKELENPPVKHIIITPQLDNVYILINILLKYNIGT